MSNEFVLTAEFVPSMAETCLAYQFMKSKDSATFSMTPIALHLADYETGPQCGRSLIEGDDDYTLRYHFHAGCESRMDALAEARYRRPSVVGGTVALPFRD